MRNALALLGLVFALLILLHGGFLVAYGSVDACEVAWQVKKAKHADDGIGGAISKGAMDVQEAFLGKEGAAGQYRRKHGTFGCYTMAVLGVE